MNEFLELFEKDLDNRLANIQLFKDSQALINRLILHETLNASAKTKQNIFSVNIKEHADCEYEILFNNSHVVFIKAYQYVKEVSNGI